MRSTRAEAAARHLERWAPALAAALPLGLLVTCAALVPPAPQGPAYLGAGHETPRRGGTLRVHHESDLRSLDPAGAYDEISLPAVALLFDTLLDYDDAGALVPGLLRRVPAPAEDGVTYRLEVRDGVRFHDGSALDAEDLRFTFERLADPRNAFRGSSLYGNVLGFEDFRAGRARHLEGLEVVDARTLQVRLASPDHTFPYLLALSFVAPVPREAYAGGERAHDPVGTGPFRLESWEPAVRLVVRRNPTYWRPGRPFLDRVVYELNLARGPAFLRFRRGEMDVVSRQMPADHRLLMTSPAWAPYRTSYSVGSVWGLEMNCELPPFDDVHVRRAVAAAIDRESWALARGRRLAPLGQPLPPGFPGHDPDLRDRQRYDLPRAREEMRLAGHPDGLPDPIDLWLGEGPVARAYGELAQSDLARIGITVRLRQVSFGVYLRETARPKTVALFLGGWLPDYPDPSTFFDPLFHSRAAAGEAVTNKAFYRNARVDALLDRARATSDPAARRELYREASALVAADAPWAFVFTELATQAWQPTVRNYRPTAIRPSPYRDVWLDLPRRPAQGAGAAPAPRSER